LAFIGRGRLLYEGTLGELQSRQRGRVVVEVDRPTVASSVLRQAGWTVERVDDTSLTVELSERADVADAAAMLVGAGFRLYQLRTVRPSLEDLFLDLTSGANLASPPIEEVIR
jgi:ABC-type multidrug transport system ATPase subunit